MDKIGLYIHIPFCDCKCAYCDFYSISNNCEYDYYTQKLIEKIKLYSKRYNKVVETIYFGGGTPSVLGSDRLCSILETIKSSFTITEDCEITVEVNPSSADRLDFQKMKSAGFNRLSIGMQSAIDSELKLLSRRHTAQKARETVLYARECGFDNISLDLMLCVPTQTKNSLTESIKFCKDCDIQHISAYILKIEEGTDFYRNRDNMRLFNDDEQADLYLHVINELEKYGYHQYEISNFSKSGYEGKHNLKYWRDEEYLGLGPSAHSYIDGRRFYFERSFEKFYNDEVVEDGNGGDIEEYIMLKLRLVEGLNLDDLYEKYNYIVEKRFTDKLAVLENQGLIQYNDKIISLTKDGFLVSNSIINYILDAI